MRVIFEFVRKRFVGLNKTVSNSNCCRLSTYSKRLELMDIKN